MKKASLSDIAQALGVSKTLVSFVINGRAEEKGISKETTKKVLEKIKELNYQPNSLARGLRTGKSKTIGVVVADISNAFYASVCKSIEQAVMNQGYNVVLSSTDEDPDKERKILRMMWDRGMDGIILAPTRPFTKKVERELNDLEIPIILIDRHYPDSNLNHVVVNNFQISYEATQHLIQNGHSNIAYIAIKPTHTSVMQDRLAGFVQALKDAKIPFKKNFYNELSLEELSNGIYDKLDCLHYKQGKATAVVSSNNKVTLALLECFKIKDIQIPDDISLVSFDFLDVFKILTPPISSIQLFAEDIGNQSAAMLLKKLNGVSTVENTVLQAKFHSRASVKKLT